jgi:Flp pilus assembly protein TadD
MGLARLRRGETRLALEAFRKAAALEPDNPEYHNRLALGLSRAREGDCGLEAIAKALELLPDAPHLLDSLGTVRLARDEPLDAIAAYRRAVALEPNHAVYRFNLSVALARHGETRDAENERAEALRLDPKLALPADGEPII